jgi:hypothetical protein
MRPCPLLAEYASKEYGQGIRCLFLLPSGDPGLPTTPSPSRLIRCQADSKGVHPTAIRLALHGGG